jgi:hypothetical protein
MSLWDGTKTTASAQEKLIEAVREALAKETWVGAGFVMADRRDVNNKIIRADEDVEKAEAVLADLRARREDLLRKELALGGRLEPETGEPAA